MTTESVVLGARTLALATTGVVVAGVSPLVGAILGLGSAAYGAVKAKSAMGRPMLIGGVVAVSVATMTAVLAPHGTTTTEITRGPVVVCVQHPTYEGC